MELIVYAKEQSGHGEKLEEIFRSLGKEIHTELLSSLESLTDRLLSTNYEEAVVILTTDNRDDLTELLPVLPLFRRMRIILLLPDQEPETIKIGYQLEPRFLSYIDMGLDEIQAVVKKMLKRISAGMGKRRIKDVGFHKPS